MDSSAHDLRHKMEHADLHHGKPSGIPNHPPKIKKAHGKPVEISQVVAQCLVQDSSAKKGVGAKDSEVYDYFLNDEAKSKQKTEAVTQAEWSELAEARADFLKYLRLERVFSAN